MTSDQPVVRRAPKSTPTDELTAMTSAGGSGAGSTVKGPCSCGVCQECDWARHNPEADWIVDDEVAQLRADLAQARARLAVQERVVEAAQRFRMARDDDTAAQAIRELCAALDAAQEATEASQRAHQTWRHTLCVGQKARSPLLAGERNPG